MRLSSFFKAPRPFVSITDLKFTLSELDHPQNEDFERAEALLIFESARQKTWLIATNLRLYCLFDIAAEERPRVKWKIDKSHLVSDDDGVIVKLSLRESTRRTGFIQINDKNPRKYSKLLFTMAPITRAIRIMLMKAFDIPI